MKKMTMVLGMLLMVMSISTYVSYADEVTYGAGAALVDESYTLEEMLQYALEDERLAQAEYNEIMASFDVTRPFANIVKAEVKHEAAVIRLYEARDMTVPEFNAEDHILIPDSLDVVYEIGIEAEINNIAMYDAFLEQELDEDVRLVFEALRDGSVKHLEAFKRANDRPSAGRNARR